MWYIVWQNPYQRYSSTQGDGYFVGYKNKCEDSFSKNWFEAKRYKSFKSAVERLGIKMNSHMLTGAQFCEGNIFDEQSKRDFKLNKLLDTPDPDIRNFIFSKGRIDKIDEKGNFCGDASDEVVKWVEGSIRSNIKSSENQRRKFEKLGLKSDPKEDVSTEAYLDDFMDFFK